MLVCVDHGNKQIKTASRVFTSGLVESDTRPPFGDNILFYRGKYYTLSDQRIPYTRDKTEDDRFFILTLFAIAYQIDAKSGSIIYAGKYITLSEAKKIALDDAGCEDKVSFTEETLVSGGIKTPYYQLVFADAKTQWTYRIDAVLGTVLEKQQKEIVTTDFISLEEAKEIALKDAGLNEAI